jgi:hypothetical protein
MRRALVVLTFFVLCHEVSFAEIYKWTDENGQVHFSDRIPSNLQAETKTVPISSYRGVSYGNSTIDTGKKLDTELGAQGVPVILVGKQRMNGFTQAGFERIYR